MPTKKYVVVYGVVSASGTQSYLVDADTPEEANKLVLNGEGQLLKQNVTVIEFSEKPQRIYEYRGNEQ